MKKELLEQVQKIVLVGYGTEGRSSEKFFQKHFSDTSLEILDPVSAPIIPQKNTVYVISPGVDRLDICQHIPADFCTSNSEIFFANISEKNRQKVIGITGTKGKSTTTKFLYECLLAANFNAQVGGNYGTALLDFFDEIENLDYLVAELSSYQLEFAKISAGKSIFLNIFADHLDRHKTLELYTKFKTNLWNGAEKKSDICVIPSVTKADLIAKKLWNLFELKDSEKIFHYSNPVDSSFFASDSVFGATHFCENFGTVQTLLTELIGAEKTTATLKKVAQNFVGLPHRTEFFAEYEDYKFYDDSISSNPDTAVAAVKFFDKNLGAIVLGGFSGGGTYDELFELFLANTPDVFVFLPKSNTRDEILAVAKDKNFPANQIILGENFDEILIKGMPYVSKNLAVVLSPGGKGYDYFSGYVERGEKWKAAVHKYFL